MFCVFQDLQAEIEVHEHAYASLQATGRQILQQPEKGIELRQLQSRLDEMNQRWNRLRSKSMEIRSVEFNHL